MPLKVGQGCPIVNMGGMDSSKFPPAIGQASHMAHSLSFVHQSVHELFCTSILLWHVGGRVVNSPLSKLLYAVDLYSPPKSDIQPCNAWNCIFTIWRNWQVAIIAALFVHNSMVQAIEVKSSRKMIKYLYLWYKSVGKDLISIWISSKVCLVCMEVGGKEC